MTAPPDGYASQPHSCPQHKLGRVSTAPGLTSPLPAPNTTPWLSLRSGDSPGAPARAGLAVASRNKWLWELLSWLAGLWQHQHLPGHFWPSLLHRVAAVSIQGLTSKSTSGTHVLGDSFAWAWECACMQNVPMAELAHGHCPAAMDVPGSRLHQGGERQFREGGGGPKHYGGAMERIFQCQSHGAAQPQHHLPGTHPRMGPRCRYQPSPSCHILQHPSTSTEASREEQWGS